MGARAVRIDDRDIELSDSGEPVVPVVLQKQNLIAAARRIEGAGDLEHSAGGRDGQSVAEKPLLQAQGHIFDFAIHQRRRPFLADHLVTV